jgi:hypothetical protein
MRMEQSNASKTLLLQKQSIIFKGRINALANGFKYCWPTSLSMEEFISLVD